MKISLKFVRQHLGADLPDDLELIISRIGQQLGEVEDVNLDLSALYEQVLVAKVVSAEPIEASDHLKLCLIDDGGVFQQVDRQPNGLIEVVCGAPNVMADQLVAWLPPGSTVPSTVNKQPLVLSARVLAGKTSNGMLASPKELAIGDNHDGIMVLDEDAHPGASFKDLYSLDDQIIDIENKMFTHRPDCFGLLGVARELNGIFNKPFHSPDWYLNSQDLVLETEKMELSVDNQLPELVPRFTAVVLDNIEIGPSSVQVQSLLARLGVRPVNNIVDATNVAMLISGQPFHAYDYQKLANLNSGQAKLTIRLPKDGESLTLLNGKTIRPRPEAIMIAAGDKCVGVGGVMGSADSEVDNSTKVIVLESATFDMYSIRRTSMELGLFSDAVTRFSKGQSPLQTKQALNYCVSLLKQACHSAKVASVVVDDNHLSNEVMSRNSLHPEVEVGLDYINDRLGSDLTAEAMASLLTNVEFEVSLKSNSLIVKAPFWRTDIEIKEDIVEEIGRLYGYQNLSLKALTRPLEAVSRNQELELKSNIRRLLARAGANELLTYSFVSSKLIENSDQDLTKTYALANSMSPEFSYYRLSLTPSLLSKVHPNIKAGYKQFALFEIGTAHQLGLVSQVEPDMPGETGLVSLVFASKEPASGGAAYYHARAYLSFILDKLKLTGYKIVPFSRDSQKMASLEQVLKPFDPDRSALVVDQDSKVYGVVGEYSANVCQKFKLPTSSSGFELDLALLASLPKLPAYKTMSKYPSIKQDITLKVDINLAYADIQLALSTALESLVAASSYFELQLLDIFSSKDDPKAKHLSFRLTLTDNLRTLSDQQVTKLLDELAAKAADLFKAERI